MSCERSIVRFDWSALRAGVLESAASIPVADARAVVVTLLTSGQVPPLQPTLFDGEYTAARPGLQRFWGTACLCDEVVYLILFINERCLVLTISG